MKVGHQRAFSHTSLEQAERHIFGGYNWMSDKITWTTAETKKSSQFIYFLEELR